jgi:hypothetical protein
MIAAIAHLGDHDIWNDEVRTFAYACLCGAGWRDLLKDMGFTVRKHLTAAACKSISKAALRRISRGVASRLACECGERGLVYVAKAAPFIGAATGAYLETRYTRTVGRAARDWFIAA